MWYLALASASRVAIVVAKLECRNHVFRATWTLKISIGIRKISMHIETHRDASRSPRSSA